MAALSEGRTLGGVLSDLFAHPGEMLIRRWNWKSAILSSIVRGLLFFFTNLSAGYAAAWSALVTELAFRGVTAGFYGALTQALRDAKPAWTGTVAALILLPVTGHSVELAVHWVRGTARLGTSLTVSVAFTAVSTAFNLFAMRRGVLIVGAGGGSIGSDLLRTPALLVQFVLAILGAGRRPPRFVRPS